jgi:hypothetical protein
VLSNLHELGVLRMEHPTHSTLRVGCILLQPSSAPINPRQGPISSYRQMSLGQKVVIEARCDATDQSGRRVQRHAADLARQPAKLTVTLLRRPSSQHAATPHTSHPTPHTITRTHSRLYVLCLLDFCLAVQQYHISLQPAWSCDYQLHRLAQATPHEQRSPRS